MFLGLCTSQSRLFHVRGLHFGRKFGAEDIIFKAVSVNIRQRKWKFLDQLSSKLTESVVSRVFREFQSSPHLLLEFYQRIGGQKSVYCSLESCCIVVRVMVDRKNYEDALCLMKQLMITKGHTPLEILEALIHSHHEMPFPNCSVFDTLVRACTQIGSTNGAYEVIERLRGEDCWVSIHAWNNFLSHLLKTGDVGHFWMRYQEMIFDSYYENVNTFNLIILALCKECKFSEAFSAFYKMLKRGILPNVVGFNMLVDGACRAYDLELAIKLVEKIGTMSMGYVMPNTVTYNCLVNGFCKKGNPEIAEKILDKMMEMGFRPNIRTYATVVDGYSRSGCIEHAYRLCEKMVEKGFSPNSAVYNSLIHQLYLEGDVSGASFLVSNMVENNVPPDEVTDSIIMKGLCRNGQIDEALRIHKWILEKNLSKDAFCHNILVSYLLRSGDICGTNQILCSMFVRGFVPDVITYGTLIEGYCKASGVQSAVEIYNDMIVKADKNPNLVILNSILDGFSKEKSMDCSVFLVDEMKRLNIYDVVTFNTLLSGYCNSGKIEEAFRLFTSMRKFGFMANKVTYNIMINLFCRFGLFEHAKELLSVMVCGGLSPDKVTYTTMLANVSKMCSYDEVVKMHDYLVLEGVVPDEQTYGAIVSPAIEGIEEQCGMSERA
ncbi:pentatricopeptide repeat-containing protein [Striga asiatica]|uniref:Pentatricopeptide repeat-containing protein n=1 Tax=Striga asiatica TaxID=4170 RepID=A0A5A7QLZ6_STRAF|nr:pentatricopeptide repeat-containing protein [Striga asiatica]